MFVNMWPLKLLVVVIAVCDSFDIYLIPADWFASLWYLQLVRAGYMERRIEY